MELHELSGRSTGRFGYIGPDSIGAIRRDGNAGTKILWHRPRKMTSHQWATLGRLGIAAIAIVALYAILES